MRATFKEETNILKIYEGSTLITQYDMKNHPNGVIQHSIFETLHYDVQEDRLYKNDDGESEEVPLKFI